MSWKFTRCPSCNSDHYGEFEKYFQCHAPCHFQWKKKKIREGAEDFYKATMSKTDRLKKAVEEASFETAFTPDGQWHKRSFYIAFDGKEYKCEATVRMQGGNFQYTAPSAKLYHPEKEPTEVEPDFLLELQKI